MAAGLVESNSKPNTNVTGTSDLAPVKKQINLIISISNMNQIEKL